MRPCAGCDVVDDGPRHVQGLVNALPGTPPPPDWHPQCHANTGCTRCAELLEELSHG